MPRKFTDKEWQGLNPLLLGVVPREQFEVTWGKGSPSAAYTMRWLSPNTIYINPNSMVGDSRGRVAPMERGEQLDALAHEAAHLIDTGPRNAPPAKALRRKNPYRYGNAAALDAYRRLRVPIEDFGSEQRAQIAEDFMTLLQSRGDPSGINSELLEFIPAYAHFVQQLKNRQIEKQTRDNETWFERMGRILGGGK